MKKNASSKSLQMMQAQADPESSVPLLGDGDDSNDKWIRPASSLNNATLATSTACGASSATSTAACNLKRTLLRQVLFFLVITGFFAQTFLWLRWESEQDQYAKMAEAELNEEYFGSDSETNVTVPVDFGKLLHQLRVHVDWINKAPNKLNGWVEPVACEIPLQVHPFDPSIAKYLIPAKPIVCPVKKEYAVQNDVTGEIKAQTKLIHSDGVICMWNTIQPFFMSNQTLKYKNKNWQRFDDQTVNMNRLNLTNVHILCKHNWVFETYSQFFEWPVLPDDGRATRAVIKTDDSAVAAGRNSAKPLPAKPKVPLVPAENGMDGLSGNDSIPESCPVNPNVLLLMVESLSRLNYLRYMNRTRDVLASWPGIVRPLDGVFKLGDNSYPNIYPLLTGRTVDDLKLRPDSTHSELAYQSLLWKQFERMRGFYHSHHEDMPYWGTFHSHGALGMLRSPADVHPREYWCALDNLHTKGAIEGSCRFTSYLCHRGEAQFGLSLRSGERFMRHVLAEGKKFFAFVDPSKLTHDDLNQAARADPLVSDFLKRNEDYLKDALVIVLGDHGNRYGPTLSTYAGHVETVMPAVHFYLPPKLNQQYPHLERYLRDNHDRLTTFLDVYQTISDLATCRLDPLPDQKPNFNQVRRYSLWREHIPPARDCHSARVPYEYCMCGRPISLNSTLYPVQRLAKKLVNSLNERLTQFKDKCAVYTLDKVIEARLLHQASPYGNNNHTHMELVFMVKPNGARFRGQGELKAGQSEYGRWDARKNIDRLDAYGKQGMCVSSWYSKYCYCKK